MYTLEEINEKANSNAMKLFWVWLLAFGIPIGYLNYVAQSYGDPPPFALDVFVFIGAGIMAWVAFYNTKKKLKEENEQEERQERDEHYKRMEELLEKMSKNNNNNENKD